MLSIFILNFEKKKKILDILNIAKTADLKKSYATY